MSNPAARQVRAKVVDLLTGLTTTGERVFASRVAPVDPQSIPCLLVYPGDEQIEPSTLSRPRAKDHLLEIRVTAFAMNQNAGVMEDVTDTIVSEVVTALEADPTLGGLVKDFMLAGVHPEYSDEGSAPALFKEMTWAARFRTREGTPDTIID